MSIPSKVIQKSKILAYYSKELPEESFPADPWSDGEMHLFIILIFLMQKKVAWKHTV